MYRRASIEPRANQKFIGETNTILNGARELTGFGSEGALWKLMGQPTRPSQEIYANDQCKPNFPRCGYSDLLYYDNQLLQHVSSRDQVEKGKWFYDYPTGTIYIGNNPQGHKVELSVTRFAFAPVSGSAGANRTTGVDTPGVVIENLIIEKYSTPAQMGAIGGQYPGSSWTVRNSEVRLNHGVGIRLWNNSQALSNRVHDNGHDGIGGRGSNLLVQDNEIYQNNSAGFNWSWQGGAGKFTNTVGLVYKRNYVHDNYGVGAWTDIDNVDALYEDNRVENNEGPGIMHEISGKAIIRNNVVRANGTKGDYVYSSGILISESQDVEAYNNQVEVGSTSGSKEVLPRTRHGIVLYQGSRRPTTDNNIHDNLITYTANQNILGGGAGPSGSGLFASANPNNLSGNKFVRNTYVMPDCSQKRWYWPSSSGNLQEFKTAGYELDGQCMTNFPNGRYRLTSMDNWRLALDVQYSATTDGTPIWVYYWNTTRLDSAQLWSTQYLGNGYYRLTPGVNANAALTVAGGAQSDGSSVIEMKWSGANEQQWAIAPLSDGTYRITPRSNLNAALDIQNDRASSRTFVVQDTWKNSSSQKWTLTLIR